MIRAKWLDPGEHAAADNICRIVFGQAPEADSTARVLLVQDGKIPVATGRLSLADGLCVLSGIATIPEMRGQGLGGLAVRMLVRMAFDSGYTEQFIKLADADASQAFFTSLGFVRTSGGMKHIGDIAGNCNGTIRHLT